MTVFDDAPNKLLGWNEVSVGGGAALNHGGLDNTSRAGNERTRTCRRVASEFARADEGGQILFHFDFEGFVERMKGEDEYKKA